MIQMKPSRYKRIGLKEIYLNYRYKKNPDFMMSNTVPDPYIKSSEVSDSPLAITYFDWKPFIDDYIACIGDCLTSAEIVRLPTFLGQIELKKIKMDSAVNRIESKAQGKTVRQQNLDHGYILRMVWERDNKTARLKFKWEWKVDATISLLKKAYALCDNDYTYINKFRNK